MYCVAWLQVPSDLPSCSLDHTFCEDDDQLSTEATAGVASTVTVVLIIILSVAAMSHHNYRYTR